MTETCRTIQEQFSAYLDGEIDDRQCGIIDAHLHACPTCRHDLATLRRVDAALLACNVPALSPHAEALFADKLAARTHMHSWWSHLLTGPWQRMAWAGGVAALLVFGVAVFIRNHKAPVPTVIVSQTGSVHEHARHAVPSDKNKPDAPAITHDVACHVTPVVRHQNRPASRERSTLRTPVTVDNHPVPVAASLDTDISFAMMAGLSEAPDLTPNGVPVTNPETVVADASSDPEAAAVAMLAETD